MTARDELSTGSADSDLIDGVPRRRIVIASMVGTTIEFYDFYIYATAAVSVFPFDQMALLDFVPVMQRYTERPRTEMDLADASLYQLAADTGVTRIMTMDRRDFSRYRLPDGQAFEIL